MENIDLNRLRDIGTRAASSCGTELLHVELSGSQRNRVLRYFIDKEDGVSLDDCSKVSEIISAYLEVEDPIPGRYHLEVSSPGVDRPFFSREDYDRFRDRKAALRLKRPFRGKKDLKGTLLGMAEGIVLFRDENLGRVEIPYDEVSRGNLIGEIDFGKDRSSGKTAGSYRDKHTA